ncbi:MAG: ethanolamine ammonia lyase-activating protein, partial [Dehalococcoidia bacterium]|nr:ethanolamine ammonia lyase-activating protein [Dehalococcoidia bacterium]
SPEFIFNNPFAFKDRYAGEDDYFTGAGKAHPGRVWDSNFISDVPSFKLVEWERRGAGGRNILFELADNTLAAHISEFPVCTYKKGHRHGPGAHVIIISGEGYSLLWQEGKPRTRVDWHAGSMLVPPDLWFHQHFNVGAEPARYLALRWGSKKYRVSGSLGLTSDTILNTGNQIEYENEDPEIRRMFETELSKRGVESRMAPFFQKVQ